MFVACMKHQINIGMDCTVKSASFGFLHYVNLLGDAKVRKLTDLVLVRRILLLDDSKVKELLDLVVLDIGEIL